MFDPVTASSLVTTIWVMHYIRVQNFLFTIWTSRVSKDEVIEEKRISLLHRGPLCAEENLYPGISFFRYILSLR
jgi:hypothetical protein